MYLELVSIIDLDTCIYEFVTAIPILEECMHKKVMIMCFRFFTCIYCIDTSICYSFVMLTYTF